MLMLFLYERGIKYVCQSFGIDELNRFLYHVIDLFKVRFISNRNYYSLDPCFICSHSLFTESANRENFSVESYLTCHCNISTNRDS